MMGSRVLGNSYLPRERRYMRYYGLPELGYIELQYCNIQTHIHTPTRGLITKMSCELYLRNLFGCDDCSKRNKKRAARYLKKYNLKYIDRVRINEHFFGQPHGAYPQG